MWVATIRELFNADGRTFASEQFSDIVILACAFERPITKQS